VDNVECRVPAGAATIICEPWERKQAPIIANEAKYSLPYCMALAFLGIPVTAAHFLEEEISAEAVAFGRKISWTPMLDADFPKRFEAEICVNFRGGRQERVRIEQVKGSAERPASTAEIKAKFVSNTEPHYSKAQQQRLIDLVLEGAADRPVVELASSLRAR
jgi:2-methylcitrate dehydratase PrpD